MNVVPYKDMNWQKINNKKETHKSDLVVRYLALL